jgi:hypothetical protein
MRASERVLLLIALAVPLVVIAVSWPLVAAWVTAPAAPNAEVAGVEATAAPTAASTARAAPTARPTTTQPTTQPTAPTQGPTALPTARLTPIAAATLTTTDGPAETVASFYSLVSNGDVDDAATLWTPRMRAAFPPQQNIVERFAQTSSITLRRADVVAQTDSAATVNVDVVELDAAGQPRHFTGAWHLVRSESGWLLDQPELQVGP